MTDIRSSLFGRLATETGLITLDQIQECLNLQVEYKKAGKKVPRLGELMASKGFLTVDQVRDLLRQQKTSQAVVQRPPDPVLEAAGDAAAAVPSDPGESVRYQGGEVFGKFKILKRLGADSSGYTYKAKYIPRDVTVTLRVLSRETMATSPEYVAAFEEKVKAANGLKHAGIQRIVAAGQLHGRDYYAAEYVEGISLKRVLEARGHLDVAFCLDLATQIVKALEYGHARGVYHQELRPSNILIAQDRSAKLIAFGVAHDVIGNLERIAATTGESPFYVAPEQAIEGAEGGRCDARTDLYCLGAVLYHALTGQPPFKGSSVREVLLNLAEEDVADPTLLNPELPAELASVVLTMMNPEPDLRYQNATVLLQELENLQASLAEAAASGAMASAETEKEKRGGVRRPGAVFEPGRRSHDTSRQGTGRRGRADVAGGRKRRPDGAGDRRAKHGSEDKNPITMIAGVLVLFLVVIWLIYMISRGSGPKPVATPSRRAQPPYIYSTTPARSTAGPTRTRPAAKPAPQPEPPTGQPVTSVEPAPPPKQPAGPTPPVATTPPETSPKEGEDTAPPSRRGLFGLEAVE